MAIHVLKTHPRAFEDVWAGVKTYEIRRDDRSFAVGDYLNLRKYYPEADVFSGDEILCLVTHKTPGGEWGIPDGMCVMAIEVQHLRVGKATAAQARLVDG